MLFQVFIWNELVRCTRLNRTINNVYDDDETTNHEYAEPGCKANDMQEFNVQNSILVMKLVNKRHVFCRSTHINYSKHCFS